MPWLPEVDLGMYLLMAEEQFVDDGGPEVVVVEAGSEPQALWVRVGPVFDSSGERPEPGVWVEYQPRYMASDLVGPVLLTPELWDRLDRAVRARLEGT